MGAYRGGAKDGDYGRADEIFFLPDVYRSKENG
ncbi:hypothetical protein GGE12_000969 [Rhizobium mongolense]|uniref:Uncharacterized protein n=1 Tax=Rhizobium mongolense TaxID=57676 RepID=A0A7W6WCX6_9HYPH|nr:hypothetical protein [Rhizobium mongolense]